jgi:hypothetical protein
VPATSKLKAFAIVLVAEVQFILAENTAGIPLLILQSNTISGSLGKALDYK